MADCPFDFVNDGKKHTICLVGGGGKTTVMNELAAVWATCGRKILVLTSTHILWMAALLLMQRRCKIFGSSGAMLLSVHRNCQQVS